MPRTYEVTAKELIIHTYRIEAADLDEAEELALNGCPDFDCNSIEFEITKIKYIKGA